MWAVFQVLDILRKISAAADSSVMQAFLNDEVFET